MNNHLLAHLEDNDLSGRQFWHAAHLWNEAFEKHGVYLDISVYTSKTFDNVWQRTFYWQGSIIGNTTNHCNWTADLLRADQCSLANEGSSSVLLDRSRFQPRTTFYANDLLEISGIFGEVNDNSKQ